MTTRPPCRELPKLQNLSLAPKEMSKCVRDYKRAKDYARRRLELTEKQHAGHRTFLFEAPLGGGAWKHKGFAATTAGCAAGLCDRKAFSNK